MESEGEGSGVEIIQNHPYTEGPHGSGQYTYKVRCLEQSLTSHFSSFCGHNDGLVGFVLEGWNWLKIVNLLSIPINLLAG